MTDRARQSANLLAIAVAIMLLLLMIAAGQTLGATYRTANFTVEAESQDTAYKVATTAEHWRSKLWKEWLNSDPPGDWYKPCRVEVSLATHDGGGATKYVFEHGEVFALSGTWSGRLDPLLSDVVPHEVMHLVLASHFRKPLPRWVDEGICTSVEGPAGKNNQIVAMKRSLAMKHLYPLARLMSFENYPADVATFYWQSHSVTEYLIRLGGKEKLILCCQEGFERGWGWALYNAYGFFSVHDLEKSWLGSIHRTHTARKTYEVNQPCGPNGCNNGWVTVPGAMSSPPPVVQVIPTPTFRDPRADPKPQPDVRDPREPTLAEQPVGQRITDDVAMIKNQIKHLENELAHLQQQSVLVDSDKIKQQVVSELAVPDLTGFVRQPDLNGYATKQDLESKESSILTRVQERIENFSAAGAGRKAGTLAVTALGISGPLGWGIVAASTIGSWFLGRQLQRNNRRGGRRRRRFRA